MSQEPSAAEIYGRDFPAGAAVFDEGDPASRMYVVVCSAAAVMARAARLLEIDAAAFAVLVQHDGGELAEVGGLPPMAGLVEPLPAAELLRARLSSVGTVRDAAELRDLLELSDLRRRFEPEERPRSTP